MINGNIEDFEDKIYYGEDVYLIYNGKRLFVDGWVENDVFTLRMMDYDDIDNEQSIYNFEISDTDKDKVVKEFLNKKIWNNKSFYEEASKIEWSEPF